MSPDGVGTPTRSADELHIPAGTASDGTDPLVLTPERCGWRYAGLRVLRLKAGEQRELQTGEDELAVLPLAGGACSVEVAGATFTLHGRESVFARVTDFAYVGRDAELRITATEDVELALPSAKSRRAIDAYYVAAEQVPVETRGAGSATRQLNNFLAPDRCEADRLTAVEVLTPRGNWSSYPPHKHDDASSGSGEAELEEIYYFRISGGREGFGAHRTYDMREGWDVLVTVRDGDTFLVPRGYHGPCMAAPDYDMYYLNVLAGPADERSLAFSDDPPYAPIRATWDSMQADPRVPLTAAPPERDR